MLFSKPLEIAGPGACEMCVDLIIQREAGRCANVGSYIMRIVILSS